MTPSPIHQAIMGNRYLHQSKKIDLNKIIIKFYQQDKIYSKILENPKVHAKFGIKEGLIFMKNNLSRDVICISPKAIHKGK